MNRTIFKDEVQMLNKHMEKHLASLTIKKMPINETPSHPNQNVCHQKQMLVRIWRKLLMGMCISGDTMEISSSKNKTMVIM